MHIVFSLIAAGFAAGILFSYDAGRRQLLVIPECLCLALSAMWLGQPHACVMFIILALASALRAMDRLRMLYAVLMLMLIIPAAVLAAILIPGRATFATVLTAVLGTMHGLTARVCAPCHYPEYRLYPPRCRLNAQNIFYIMLGLGLWLAYGLLSGDYVLAATRGFCMVFFIFTMIRDLMRRDARERRAFVREKRKYNRYY